MLSLQMLCIDSKASEVALAPALPKTEIHSYSWFNDRFKLIIIVPMPEAIKDDRVIHSGLHRHIDRNVCPPQQ